jgi:hypothetical protein
MPKRFKIDRPARSSREKKEKFVPPAPSTLKSGVSGGMIGFSMKLPDVKITPREDGKTTTEFDILGHRFKDKR